ncbi:hypothetical protein DNTS_032792 [Danionella cerebrum]|uniref:Vitelline membrane outer layer protein 1 homolog n=1 Tax=Danionella cerebrum TaxID=2873325 RepID=A0A553R4M5_9TELE|nr:hypothetical protein DNTS_032792 [Danionella translucida]
MASEEHLSSPESSITSLLASSGRLQSSFTPEPASCIRYRDKPYSSATEALDAYISDYQRSLSAGRILLPKETPKAHSQKNRDVLRSSLTDGELNVLNLPARRRDPDQLSLTTDDLLTLPIDGSLPVTRTSALVSRSGFAPMGASFKYSPWSRSRPPRCHLNQSIWKTINVDDLQRTPSANQTLASRSPTHWMTNQRSEMGFSDLKYPLWPKRHEDAGSYVQKSDPPSHPRIPSWVGELEEERAHTKDGSVDYLMLGVKQMLNSTPLSKNVNKLDRSRDTEEVLDADRSWDDPLVTFKSPVPVGLAEEHPSHQELQGRKSAGASCSSEYSSRKHPGPVEALKHMLFRLQDVQHEMGPTLTPHLQLHEDTDAPEPLEKARESHVPSPKHSRKPNIFFTVAAPALLWALEPTLTPLDPHFPLGHYPGHQKWKSWMQEAESRCRALHHLRRLKALVDDMNERKSRAEHAGIVTRRQNAPDSWTLDLDRAVFRGHCPPEAQISSSRSMQQLLSLSLAFLLLLSGVCSSSSGRPPRSISRSFRSLLRVHNGMRWGSWGQKEMCPGGTYAAGFSLKVAGMWESLLVGDNTALNGIRLHCIDPSKRSSGPYDDYATVQSDVGSWGKWSDIKWCLRGLLTSFQLRVEPYRGTWDDTAANNIRFNCTGNEEELLGSGTSWGDWGDWSDSCGGKGICGIETMVEEPQGVGDDTALNDVRMFCCD